MPAYQIPKSKFDVLRNTMIGWYRAGADEEPKSNSDVEGYTNISKSTISRQNKFLTQLGILKKEGHKRQLTEEGTEITQALARNQDKKAKRLLRPLLEDIELTEQIHSIMEISGPLSEEEVIEEMASITGHDTEERRVKTGLRAFIHLYEWVGYFESDDGQYHAVSRSELEEPSVETIETDEGNDTTADETGSTHGVDGPATPHSMQTQSRPPITGGGLNITVEISADHGPKDIRNAIIAIREGLQYDLDQSTNENSDELTPTILTDFENKDAEPSTDDS